MPYTPSNLEAAVHQRWDSKTELAAACPASRVFTGLAPPDTAQPYVSLSRLSNPPDRRANVGDVEEVQLRLQVFADRFDAGRRVVELAKCFAGGTPAGFNRDSFPIDARQQVLVMLPDNEFYLQDEDTGLWQFTLDWVVRLQRLRTA